MNPSGGTPTWQIKGTTTAVVLADRLLMPDEAFGYLAFQSLNGNDKATMVGWVPMGDINAYMAPIAPGDGSVEVLKNYPYPVDCPEELFSPYAPTSLGFVESGFTEDNTCTLRFPWPDGVGPLAAGYGPGQPFGDDGRTSSQGSAWLVEGAISITRLIASNNYWSPINPVWRLESAGIAGQTEIDYLFDLASFGGPNAVLTLFGTILEKGRGRLFKRTNAGNPANGQSQNDAILEWRRRRPYSWRL